MHAHTAPHSRRTLWVLSILLLATHTLFLWMFFSADGVVALVSRGRVSAPAGLDLPFLAGRSAAQWKHGMAGNSPLYMPGFFAVGFFTWLWSIGRPLRALLAPWLVILLVGLALAAWLSPTGNVHAVRWFETTSGLSASGMVPGVTIGGVAAAVFTLFTWTTAIVCLQLSIAKRSAWPMVVPVVLHYLLLVARPWAINDFATQWLGDARRGVPVAIVSLVAVPVLVAALVAYQLRREAAAERVASRMWSEVDADRS